MTQGPPSPQRRPPGRRLLFHRRSGLARTLAVLGLSSLTLGYAVPFASAATTVGGDRWVLSPVAVPSFAHPQFEGARGAAERAADGAVPAAGRAAEAGERVGSGAERKHAGGSSGSADVAAPAASGGANGTVGAGDTGGAQAPTQQAAPDPAGPPAADVPDVVDTNWGEAPQAPSAPEEDPFADLPIVDSGTGPVVAIGADPLENDNQQAAVDPLDPTQLPPLPPDDSGVIVEQPPVGSEGEPADDGSPGVAKDRGKHKGKPKPAAAASSRRPAATSASAPALTGAEIDAVIDEVLDAAAAQDASAAEWTAAPVEVASSAPAESGERPRAPPASTTTGLSRSRRSTFPPSPPRLAAGREAAIAAALLAALAAYFPDGDVVFTLVAPTDGTPYSTSTSAATASRSPQWGPLLRPLRARRRRATPTRPTSRSSSAPTSRSPG